MCGQYNDGIDISPGKVIDVYVSYKGRIGRIRSSWGMMIRDHLIINAKAETINERVSFKDLRHCVIKAKNFYEWDKDKNKVSFSLKGNNTLYMAGLIRRANDHYEHVIITTQPNDDVKNIHDRMPLLLNKDQIEDWLNHQQTDAILHSLPGELNVHYLKKQLSLFEEDL